MKEIYLGKIVSTHGIKGELKIKSSFQYKDKAFKSGNTLIIDSKNYIIKTYRRHKDYEMVTLNDYTNINEVEFLLKKKVYISEDILNLNSEEVLDEELINYNVIIGNKKGQIKEIFFASPTNKILRIDLNGEEVLVPFIKEFVKKIDKDKHKVYIEIIDGMIIWQ